MMLKFFPKGTGIVKATGKERVDFFNRMSTNDVSKLKPGDYTKTVFTTDKGRIVDAVTLMEFDEHTLMVTSEGFEERLISHLDKYIIMDDVQLAKERDFISIKIFGENVLEETGRVYGLEITDDGKFHTVEDNVYVYYDGFRNGSVNVVCKSGYIDTFRKKITDAEEMGENEYERHRIKEGIAEGENELNEQVNPVECGFAEYVSFTKGCYIGQEVIARLDSQGKIPKQMVRIEPEGEGEFRVTDKIYFPAPDGEGKKETGFVSSVSVNTGNNGNGEDNGKAVGLGFIRSVNLDYGKPYVVENNGKEIKIRIFKII